MCSIDVSRCTFWYLSHNIHPRTHTPTARTMTAFLAVLEEDFEELVSLYEAGVDIDAPRDWSGFPTSPLQLSIVSGNTHFTHLLLGYGANPERVDRFGMTVLCSAVSRGCLEAVEMLLESKADVAARTPEGLTALHLAGLIPSRVGGQVRGDIGRALIAAGADVSARDNKGWTPLHSAVATPLHRDMIHILVREGARISAMTLLGETVPMLARTFGFVGLAESLQAVHDYRERVRRNRCHAFAQGLYNPRANGRSVVHGLPQEVALKILKASQTPFQAASAAEAAAEAEAASEWAHADIYWISSLDQFIEVKRAHITAAIVFVVFFGESWKTPWADSLLSEEPVIAVGEVAPKRRVVVGVLGSMADDARDAA
jgi:hypothetical protein